MCSPSPSSTRCRSWSRTRRRPHLPPERPVARVPAMPRKPRVAVVFGGRSSEHAISCVTAGSVLAALDRDRYDVVPVGITEQGRWVLAPDDSAALAIRGGTLPSVQDHGGEVLLPTDPARRDLVVLEPGAVPRALGDVDV